MKNKKKITIVINCNSFLDSKMCDVMHRPLAPCCILCDSLSTCILKNNWTDSGYRCIKTKVNVLPCYNLRLLREKYDINNALDYMIFLNKYKLTVKKVKKEHSDSAKIIKVPNKVTTRRIKASIKRSINRGVHITTIRHTKRGAIKNVS